MDHRVSVLLFFAWFLGVAACATPEPAEEPEDFLSGLPPQKARALSEARLRRIAADARSAVCTRPVLKGEPIPGEGSANLASILAPVDGFAECVALLDRVKYELDPDLVGEDFGEFPSRDGGVIVDWLPEMHECEVAPFDTACSGAIDRLRRTVRNEDVCGPEWPVSCSVPFEQWHRLSRLLDLVAWRARRLFAFGDFEGGTSLSLDALQYADDVSRSSGGPINLVLSAISVKRFTSILERALNDPAEISEEDLLRLDDRLDALMRMTAHPFYAMVADALCTARLPVDGMGAGPSASNGFGDRFLLEESAFLRATRYRTFCPPTTTVAECFVGLQRASGRCSALEEWSESVPISVINRMRALTDPKEARRQVRETMMCGTEVHPTVFTGSTATRLFSLAALRTLARYRLEAQEGSDCPGIEFFGSYELDEAMIDPTSGGRIRVEEIGLGQFVLRPSRDFFDGRGDRETPAVFIDCPFDGFADERR